MSNFLFEGLRLLEKLDLHKTPLAKTCCHANNHVVSMLEVLHRRSLAHSENPNRWRTPIRSQSYCPITLKFLISTLLYRSLNPTLALQVMVTLHMDTCS